MTQKKAHNISKILFVLGFFKPIYVLTNSFKTAFRSDFLIHGLFIGLAWYALSLITLHLFFVKNSKKLANNIS